MAADTPSTQQVTTTVKDAAQTLSQMLGLPVSNWGVYKMLDAGEIRGRYKGGRRLVEIASLREYVDNLPTERPKMDGAS